MVNNLTKAFLSRLLEYAKFLEEFASGLIDICLLIYLHAPVIVAKRAAVQSEARKNLI